MTKNSYLLDRFLCQIKILLLDIKKFKNPTFLQVFCSKFQVYFSKFLKFQVFPGFQVKWQPCIFQIKIKIKFFKININKVLEQNRLQNNNIEIKQLNFI